MLPIRWIEKPSWSDVLATAEGNQLTLHGKVVGTRDYNFALGIVNANTPVSVIVSGSILYRNRITLTHSAFDHFEADLEYIKSAGEITWDFDTTGGTIHITQAKNHIRRYKVVAGDTAVEVGADPGVAVPKHDGAIAVDKDEVKGCDIVIPALRVNISFAHPLGYVTFAWAKVLADTTGKVNSTQFFEWAPGEVLFLGARGQDGTNAPATITYSFAMSKNESEIVIGALADIHKEGWEYLWIKYMDNVSADYPAKPPQFVYIERVYDQADFTTLFGFG